ncbi:hypothetical protein [Cutibacterium avidum]
MLDEAANIGRWPELPRCSATSSRSFRCATRSHGS